MLLDLLAWCLWVLCGFFFTVVVGCCSSGEVGYCRGGEVGCCCGSIGSWWWGFAMVFRVGFVVVGLWWRLSMAAKEAMVDLWWFFVLSFWW